MLSTVLVGNSSTYVRAGLMITPRGYSHKYDGLTGELKEGERSGRSLSMGFDGWKACVRRYLRDATPDSLEDVARHFDAPPGEILSAIAEAGVGDSAGAYAAVAIRPGGEAEILQAARGWGPLRAVVRSDAGAVSELFLEASELNLGEDRLTLENEHFRLHIDWSRVYRCWLLRRNDGLRSLYFTGAQRDILFNLSLFGREGRFEQGAVQCFDRVWERLCLEHG
jgi:precorrin-3B C17-methyltransferase